MARFGIGAKRQKVGRGQHRIFTRLTGRSRAIHHADESIRLIDSNN
jgi:hypothetical protein